MSKNITFAADEAMIEEARAAAKAENSSLNQQFRLWLEGYIRESRMKKYEAVMTGLRGKVVVGRKLSRDEMNERRDFSRFQHSHLPTRCSGRAHERSPGAHAGGC